MAAFYGLVKTFFFFFFYLFGKLKSKPVLPLVRAVLYDELFLPGLGAICEGSRWYFSGQLVTCALFPSPGRVAWGRNVCRLSGIL